MSSIRRSLIWLGLLIIAVCIVAGLRQLIVVPAVKRGYDVRILNPDQVVIAKPSEVVVFAVKLQNSGSESVAITGCEVGCSCTTPQDLPVTLPANSECILSFGLTGAEFGGSDVHQEIRIYTMPPIPGLVASVISRVESISPPTSILD